MNSLILMAMADELEKIATSEKTAAPRWIKELPKLSPSGFRRLEGIGGGVREIKPVGWGGERVADLVYHPGLARQHGPVVRKVPHVQNLGRQYMEGLESASQKQMGMEERLREIAGGQGPFAHILERGPKGEAYYQFAAGEPADAALRAQLATLEPAVAKAHKAYLKVQQGRAPGTTAWQVMQGPEYRRHQELHKQLKDVQWKMHLQGRAPEGADPILERLEQEYPKLHDIRSANIVGGKIVDLSPEMRGLMHDSNLPKMPYNSPTMSKKIFLGQPPRPIR